MRLSSYKESHPATVLNYLYAIIALTVLLYLLGVLGVLVVYSNNAITYVREQIPFYVELKDSATDEEVFRFQEELERSDFVKAGTVHYISEEEAMKKVIEDTDMTEDDVMLFGENLLPNAIIFHLNSAYVGQYKKVIQNIKSHSFVADVDVSQTEEFVKSSTATLQRISIITILLVIFFVFVAITLIKNTLKLSILANKQTIKILQVSGAATDYLTQPYIRRSLYNGLLSGGIAVFALVLTILLLQAQLNVGHWGSFIGIFIGILAVGVLTFWGSAQHSIRKYFSMPVEEWS